MRCSGRYGSEARDSRYSQVSSLPLLDLLASRFTSDCTSLCRLLSTQLPLEADGLSHLKRVRKVEGVAYCIPCASCLCMPAPLTVYIVMWASGDDGQLQIILAPPESACNVTSKSSTQLPSLDAARSKLHELCRDAQVLRVPACAPPDRERLEVWSAIWPVSLRKRPTEPRVLDTCERVRMQSCIQLALHYYGTLAPHVDGLSCPFSGAVLVDPAADTVIAVAGPDTADSAAACGCNGPGSHPLQHASMRLIADLASQGAQQQQRATRCLELVLGRTAVVYTVPGTVSPQPAAHSDLRPV